MIRLCVCVHETSPGLCFSSRGAMKTEQKNVIIQSRCCLQDLLFSSSCGCLTEMLGGLLDQITALWVGRRPRGSLRLRASVSVDLTVRFNNRPLVLLQTLSPSLYIKNHSAAQCELLLLLKPTQEACARTHRRSGPKEPSVLSGPPVCSVQQGSLLD